MQKRKKHETTFLQMVISQWFTIESTKDHKKDWVEERGSSYSIPSLDDFHFSSWATTTLSTLSLSDLCVQSSEQIGL